MTFEIGDKIISYGLSGNHTGIVKFIEGCLISFDSVDGKNWCAHIKQCRKLVNKHRKPPPLCLSLKGAKLYIELLSKRVNELENHLRVHLDSLLIRITSLENQREATGVSLGSKWAKMYG